MTPSETSNLTISGLHKSFDEAAVLRGIDLKFSAGVTAILGPNGAGKTTLIRCAIGLEEPSAGSIELCGGDLTNPRNRQMLGVMLQDSDLPELLTPHELLTLFASYYPQPSKIENILDLTNVSPVSVSIRKTDCLYKISECFGFVAVTVRNGNEHKTLKGSRRGGGQGHSRSDPQTV